MSILLVDQNILMVHSFDPHNDEEGSDDDSRNFLGR